MQGKSVPQFDGAFTALVTPFRDGAVDLEAIDALVDHQIAGKIAGLVPCGTTGESPVLDSAETELVIQRVIARVAGRALVVAGTGSNDTRLTIERTRMATRCGANAAMIVMPYYNRPTQGGLIAHVRSVHDNTDIPLVLYNVPARTASDLAVESLVEIVKHCPRVLAIKEATGNVLRTQSILATLGDRVTVLSGDDALTLPILVCGGRGVISVTSNVAPAKVQNVVTAALENRWTDARSAHLSLLSLHDVLFVESNPGPAKAALVLMNLIRPELRLPLIWPSDLSTQKIRSELVRQGLISAA